VIPSSTLAVLRRRALVQLPGRIATTHAPLKAASPFAFTYNALVMNKIIILTSLELCRIPTIHIFSSPMSLIVVPLLRMS
jgi:hypothetical protein